MAIDLQALPRELYGIIGFPLGHTMSPALHTWGFRRMGVPGVYLAWPTEPGRLKEFFTAVRVLPIRGVSVTIPHKEAAMELVDHCSDRALAAGALNTLYWRDGRLHGENTDIHGFMHPLEAAGLKPATALVLGAGGAARAVVVGLRFAGLQRIVVVNRDTARGERLCHELGAEFAPWEERTRIEADLLVNTTPLGMKGANQDATPWPAEAFRPGTTCYDLVYNPLRTRFLREAEAAGCRTIGGLDMFLHQALEQFRLWTGLQFPEDEGREVLAGLLAG